MIDFIEARKKVEQKDHSMKEKIMSIEEAARLIKDGDHVAFGGIQFSGTPMAIIREIIRQKKRDLTVSRTIVSFEGDLLLVGGCVKRVITSWFSGGVTYGVSKIMREFVEKKKVVYEEWSHYSICLRYKAGAMGIPFIPTFSMLGSDLLKHVEAKEMICPFTGQKLCLIPAMFPDVAVIHVHRADPYGNAQIDGLPYADADIARAASKVILTVEKIISNEQIRKEPWRTVIPFFCVDAVVEVPYGAYPHECYGIYEPDYKHFEEYTKITREKGVEGVKEYLDRYVYEPETFEDYLSLFGLKRILERTKAGREVYL
jgi:glutaconate CoA-transferase subunit A